jgi:hypothetical protein
VFSSWLRKLAAGNGLSERELISEVGLPQRSNLDDLDPSLLVAGIGRLAQKTGIPAEEIYQTLVASIESKIGATVNYLPHTKRPWLTRYGCSREDGKPGLVFKYATDFCARCLTESVPYFRLSWRFSLFVSCLEHKCLLSDGRNSREQSIRVPNDRYGSAAGRSLLVPDSPLRRNPSLSIEIQNLQALHMRFFTDVRSRSYFEVGLAFDYGGESVDHAVATKGGAAGEHLEENAAEGPEVGALVDGLASGLLGAHVSGGAQDHADLGGADADGFKLAEWDGGV